MDFSRFFTDIIFVILSKISLKVLCRWKCVSKQFKELLEGLDFAKEHSTHSEEQFLVAYNVFPDYCSPEISLYTKDFHFSSSHTFPARSLKCLYSISPSCEGIVCMEEFWPGQKSPYSIILWNPSIKEHRLRSTPLQTFSRFDLGFCTSVSGHNLVRISFDPKEGFYNAEFYHPRTDTWTVKSNVFACNFVREFHRYYVVYWYQRLHWLVLEDCPKLLCKIVTCDMENQSFSLNEVPQLGSFTSDVFSNLMLSSSANKLIFFYAGRGFGYLYTKDHIGAQWSVQKTIELSAGPLSSVVLGRVPSFRAPILATDDGKIVIKSFLGGQGVVLMTIEPVEAVTISTIVYRVAEVSRILKHKESFVKLDYL
ncbi:hypothetical protein TorRG33x02_289860 [Trema orientale]|uniref:F-box domain containing protein n=1 Tax=Trema orientale TaxID=63057 RepID=A0A2P5CCK4_TREOI|nr:hypothetical protein TorRG33x02_289860 [Trema orientale]